jgi:hypothetical protein
MKRFLLIAATLLAIWSGALAQSAGPTLLTADSLASGNSKDVLSSFFQLAFSDLTGPNKEVKFTSNPYAIMLRADSTLAEDPKYIRLRAWRKLNFTLDATLDSASHFNGFSIGLIYALVNARDLSRPRNAQVFQGMMSHAKSDPVYTAFLSEVSQEILTQYGNDPATEALLLEQNRNVANDSTLTVDKLDARLQTLYNTLANEPGYTLIRDSLAANPKLNFYTHRNIDFRNTLDRFQNRPLWTIGASDTSYSTGLQAKSAQLTTEFLAGFINPIQSYNLEIDVKSSLSFVDDTMETAMNLDRQVYSFQPGLNLVLKAGKKGGSTARQPYLELKVSYAYTNIWKGQLYPNERQITNTLNGTLNIRVFRQIWIPLQFSYDTKTHNVLGFLNVTTNFTTLGSLFKSAKSPS